MSAPEAPPLWSRTSPEETGPTDAPISGTVDVAVIGGGITGLSTALFCAEAGLTVHVLEAEQIGHGGSGRNVGLVNAGSWLPPAVVRGKLGTVYGPRFLESFGEAPQKVFDLVERYQIRCEATRSGTMHAAHSPSGMSDLRARHAAWSALGAPVRLLGRAETAEATGSPAFFGGLLDARAGTLNPMAYTRGLARAARAAGAQITCGARVTGLTRGGATWEVSTPRGHLQATQVVVATNAYADGLLPRLPAALTPIHFRQVATEPLGPRAAAILPDVQGLWTTAPVMVSLRREAGGRLVLGSMGRLRGRLTTRWAARTLARLFPTLGPVRLEGMWDGRIAFTPDHLPRIHRLAPGLWAPTGYNGRGITTGTLFGEAFAGLFTGADPAGLPLPLSDPRPDRLSTLRAAALEAVFTGTQAWGALR